MMYNNIVCFVFIYVRVCYSMLISIIFEVFKVTLFKTVLYTYSHCAWLTDISGRHSHKKQLNNETIETPWHNTSLFPITKHSVILYPCSEMHCPLCKSYISCLSHQTHYPANRVSNLTLKSTDIKKELAVST